MGTFRKVCRWLHRELGFFAVGLTLVYAISGIAVNHVHHWDPNHAKTVETRSIEAPGPGPTDEVEPLVLERLALAEPVRSTWRQSATVLQVFPEDGSTIDVDLTTGEVRRTSHSPRPLLFDMNFMHLNTGKGFWTVAGDVYASILIVLALSGIFLVKGRKGLAGRGGVLMVLGILLPVIYAVAMRG
ncbi:PepSY-associated TM helix domain-containing protein [bacterium]|nr:PepSY-associated TM helix domain-containing protein [bacterium]